LRWRKARPQVPGEVPSAARRARREIVARAGNRTLADKDPTAHAELRRCRAPRPCRSERLTDWRPLRDARALHHVRGGDVVARIRALFRAADPKGRVDTVLRFFAAATCHHRPEVYGGIDQARRGAAEEFFAARR